MPDKVKIGAITYDIVRDPDLLDTGFQGQIRYHKGTIVLAADMCPGAAMQTLWHEIIHGILTQAGVKKQDESLIDAIAFGVFQVLTDNPGIVKE